MTALKSLLFLIAAPGMVAGYVPLALLQRGPQIEMGVMSWLAVPLWLCGCIILLWSFWNFLREGRGTPAPVEPPKALVVVGFYRYVRNPMYVGVLATILGHFLWFGYGYLLLYAVLVFTAFNTFVAHYEEPTLKRKFGAAYDDYCKRVPRWVPRRPPEKNRFIMDKFITTPRLHLIPLTMDQLRAALQQVDALETSLHITIMRDFLTDRVRRAIGMKLEKMQKADLSQHDWLTYWLVVLKDKNAGVGMLGFKGYPQQGSTEIGYGIDPAYQGQGYMSEAVQRLIEWAFTHPYCNIITASEVENPASRRLLQKLGAHLVSEHNNSTSWEFRKRGAR